MANTDVTIDCVDVEAFRQTLMRAIPNKFADIERALREMESDGCDCKDKFMMMINAAHDFIVRGN